MRVQFLQDFEEFEDGIPLYQKGEIAYLRDEFALELIEKGVVVARPSGSSPDI